MCNYWKKPKSSKLPINLEVERSRFISSTRLSSFFSEPLCSSPYVFLGKLKIHLWTEQTKNKLQTLIWNQTRCSQLPKSCAIIPGVRMWPLLSKIWLEAICKLPQVTALPWVRITGGGDIADRHPVPLVWQQCCQCQRSCSLLIYTTDDDFLLVKAFSRVMLLLQIFASAQILPVFLQRLCFLYLQSF